MINALIDFVQEQKSQKIMKSFMNMVPRKCMVMRDGKIQSAEASSLVPGDVVQVRMGDKMPADILVFASTDL
jgi:sodium/potassium-transporting ATPase subunit alpha